MSHLKNLRLLKKNIYIFGLTSQQAPLQLLNSTQREYSKDLSANDNVISNFVNRNPRSMELLRIARKPMGYSLDAPSVNFWYRLMFEKSHRYLTAWVEHNNGNKIVAASTSEWAIRQHLFSAKDSSAAQNIGRILARRCLQAGIYEMHTELEQESSSKRVQLFLEAMVEGGVTLQEPSQIRENETYPFVREIPTHPWQVTEEYVEKEDKEPSASITEIISKKDS